MVMAVWSAANNKQTLLRAHLAITIACACTFLVVKYVEYSHKFHDGLLPGEFFRYTGPDVVPNMAIYFSFYFMMTGLHGIHVTGGIAAIGTLLYRSFQGDYNSEYYTPVDLVGLYWHLVDLIWIYLFPLLYLIS